MNMSFLKTAAVALAMLALSAQAALRPGDSAPDLKSFKLEGALPELSGRVLLVDFWASWCAPCRKSFPVMKELHEKFAARGLVIVAISVDEEKSAMESFLKKNPVPYAIARDPAGQTPKAFQAEKMPSSFVIGADGKIAAVHSGFEGAKTRAEYLEQIEAALKAAGK